MKCYRNINGYVKYIESGLGIPPNVNAFNLLAIGPLLLVLLLGVFQGFILGKPWSTISILMLSTSIATIMVVFDISGKELTTRNRLIMQGIIYLDWFIQLSLLQVLYFLMISKSITLIIILCSLQTIFPLVMGVQNDIKLKKGYFPIKTKKLPQIGYSFAWTGIAGTCIARLIFQDISQVNSIMIIIFILMFISVFFSIGLLSFQRLYYYIRLKRCGLLSEDSFVATQMD